MRITNTMMITIKQIYPVKVHINLIFTLIMNKVVQFSDSPEVFNFLILLKLTGSILERVGKALSTGVSRVSRHFQQVSRQTLVRTSIPITLYLEKLITDDMSRNLHIVSSELLNAEQKNYIFRFFILNFHLHLFANDISLNYYYG